MIVWTNLPKKGHFLPKTEKLNIATEFYIFKLVKVPKFQLKLTILIFWTQFAPKWDFYSQTTITKTNENHHRIPQICIRLCTEFQLELTILGFFGLHLPKRGIFSFKQIK